VLFVATEIQLIGKRTVGVLTKLDLMDAGTNAADILAGRVLPLKLGYVGIINRSQQNIHDKKPITDALKAETDYFRHHPAYRAHASRCGTPNLAKMLHAVSTSHGNI
jgi:dynamin 1-like protein